MRLPVAHHRLVQLQKALIQSMYKGWSRNVCRIAQTATYIIVPVVQWTAVTLVTMCHFSPLDTCVLVADPENFVACCNDGLT